jgi:sec-independent protein translocase protein TatA
MAWLVPTLQPVVGEIVGWELLLVLAIAALLFGSSKIPQLAKSLGQASKEFRKGLDEGVADDGDAREPGEPSA